MNLTCLLPDTRIAVTWAPHPCGGFYCEGAWCYGPDGPIGYWIDTAPRFSGLTVYAG